VTTCGLLARKLAALARELPAELARERNVKYGIDFRYLPKGAKLPVDSAVPVDFKVDDSHFALVPAVGDFVDIPGDRANPDHKPVRGRVRSRLFRYVLGYCYVTVVVEDADEDWAKLGSN
jgi:hypothetical protein